MTKETRQAFLWESINIFRILLIMALKKYEPIYIVVDS